MGASHDSITSFSEPPPSRSPTVAVTLVGRANGYSSAHRPQLFWPVRVYVASMLLQKSPPLQVPQSSPMFSQFMALVAEMGPSAWDPLEKNLSLVDSP